MNGVEPLQQAAEAAAQAAQGAHPPQAAQSNHYAQHPMGVPVGGRPLQQPQNNYVRENYDDLVLEGKDPQAAIAKQHADIKLSLNGGIDDNNPEQEFRDDPIGNQDNDDYDDQETPPDYDNYQSKDHTLKYLDQFSNQNKVVDKKPQASSGPGSFPQGRFL